MRKIKRYAMIGVATVGGGALLGNVFISVEKTINFFSFFIFFQQTHIFFEFSMWQNIRMNRYRV